MSAGGDNAKGVYILGKANAQLVPEKMGDVVFAYVQLVGEQREREGAGVILGAIVDYIAKSAGVGSGAGQSGGICRQKKRENGKQISPPCRLAKGRLRTAVGGSGEIVKKSRERGRDQVCGIEIGADGGGVQPFAKLGHKLGIKYKEKITLGPRAYKAVYLIWECDKHITRREGIHFRIGDGGDISFNYICYLNVSVQMRGAGKADSAASVVSEIKVRVSFFVKCHIIFPGEYQSSRRASEVECERRRR